MRDEPKRGFELLNGYPLGYNTARNMLLVLLGAPAQPLEEAFGPATPLDPDRRKRGQRKKQGEANDIPKL